MRRKITKIKNMQERTPEGPINGLYVEVEFFDRANGPKYQHSWFMIIQPAKGEQIRTHIERVIDRFVRKNEALTGKSDLTMFDRFPKDNRHNRPALTDVDPLGLIKPEVLTLVNTERDASAIG